MIVRMMAVALACCIAGTAQADLIEIPTFELILTVPEGTEDTIEPGDLRNATDAWIELIDRAAHRMDLAFFYVSSMPNEALDPVLLALERAAARGVTMRFILDKTMRKVTHGDDAEGMDRLRALPHTEIHLVDYRAAAGGVHHAKYFIVDGVGAFVGSNNLDWRSLRHIHELGMVVYEPTIVADLERIFERDWLLPHRDPRSSAGDAGSFDALQHMRSAPHIAASPVAQNPEGIPPSEQELVWLINSAKESIAIEVMVYGLHRGKRGSYRVLDDALRAAAKRGVRVRLMVESGRAEKHHRDLLSLSKDGGAEVRVVTIPPHPATRDPYARLIHAKFMVVDGNTLVLGTSNWERSYFHESRNVELVIPDNDLAQAALRTFEDVWNSNFAVDIHDVRACNP